MATPSAGRPSERNAREAWLRRAVGGAALLALLLFAIRLGTTASDETREDAPEPRPAPSAEPAEAPPEDPPASEATGQAPPAAPASEPARLHGRCTELASELPLPGAVVVVADAARRAEATAGPDGGFALAWEAPADGEVPTVRVLPRAGWSTGTEPRPLTEAELAGRDTIALEVAPDPRAHLRGRVVDALGGSGVPGLEVELDGAPSPVAIPATDDSGAFRTEGDLPSGSFTVRAFDRDPLGREPVGSLEVEHGGTEAEPVHELAVPIGPTLRVAVAERRDLPRGTRTPDASPLRARLVERRGDAEVAGVVWWTGTGWELARTDAPAEERTWSWRGLRPGEPAWIRYPRVEHEPDPSFRAWLEVEQGDGERFGAAPVPEIEGVEAVAVELRAVGTLEGRLRLGGASAADGVQLWLTPLGDDAARGPWFAKPDGSFALERLTPGAYTLSVRAPLRLALDLPVRVEPGRTSLDPVHLPAASEAHAVRGRLECALGHGAGAVLVEVRGLQAPGETRTLLVRLGSGPEPARFAVDDLPGGRYVLSPESVVGSHRFTPDEYRVATPAPEIAFRCQGTAPSASVSVEARDAATDERVDAPSVEVGMSRLKPFTWPESQPGERWFRWPLGDAPRWWVSAPGYRPVGGEGIPPESGRGGGRALRVRLEPGFGARVLVRRGEAEDGEWLALPPVPDVRVLADGVEVGATDERGELLFGTAERPATVELRHRAWRATSLAVLAGDAGPVRFVVRVEAR